jgi:hypothetical protein
MNDVAAVTKNGVVGAVDAAVSRQTRAAAWSAKLP